MVDAFLGKFVMSSRDNYDAFMKGVGVPDEYIEKGRNAKVVTTIEKTGDSFTVTRNRPQKTSTHSFKFGEPTEMENIKGEKIKVTVNLEGGKMVASGENYRVVTEMEGGKLKETITFKGHTMTRFSSRE